MNDAVICATLAALLLAAACTEPAPPNDDDDGDSRTGGRELPSGGAGAGGETHPDAPVECDTEVPRDHPSVAAAVDALATSGGTICVLWEEDEAGVIGGIDGVEITIVGTAPTPELQLVSLAVHDGALTLRNMPIHTAIINADRGSRVGISDSLIQELEVHWHAVLVDGVRVDAPATVVMERNDFENVFVSAGSSDMSLRFRNNYVHDGFDGVRLLTSDGLGSARFDIVNNTFARSAMGFELSGEGTDDLTVAWHNNVFVMNDTAVEFVGLPFDPSKSIVGSHNAFWGNGADYVGDAGPGTNGIFANVLMDFAAWPPVPLPESPLVDAADTSTAPTYDFHGNPRSAQPDIGAVESR